MTADAAEGDEGLIAVDDEERHRFRHQSWNWTSLTNPLPHAPCGREPGEAAAGERRGQHDRRAGGDGREGEVKTLDRFTRFVFQIRRDEKSQDEHKRGDRRRQPQQQPRPGHGAGRTRQQSARRRQHQHRRDRVRDEKPRKRQGQPVRGVIHLDHRSLTERRFSRINRSSSSSSARSRSETASTSEDRICSGSLRSWSRLWTSSPPAVSR